MISQRNQLPGKKRAEREAEAAEAAAAAEPPAEEVAPAEELLNRLLLNLKKLLLKKTC